ncbi:hypothetical protein Mth01_23990 [Sphaerimonospora thailandensis]|uniref:Uncharacterized protein n=1 Tax=Sphaerimonospora thailandensis TaxID=795644 RepID=A0A8J3R9B5_9ACTN|nr:hypothetical protein Mth01_23990 [Sphaerimonospora thailandensis]
MGSGFRRDCRTDPLITLVVCGVPERESRTTIRDLDGDTTVTAVRDGDRLLVSAEGLKRIAGVEFTGPGVPVLIG